VLDEGEPREGAHDWEREKRRSHLEEDRKEKKGSEGES